MHNVLLVYKQLQLQFDEDGMLIMSADNPLHVLSYDEKPEIQAIATTSFSKMTRQMLKGIRVKTKKELLDRINKYFQEINEDPIVFHWKYNLDDIDVSEEIIVDTLLINVMKNAMVT